MKKITVVIPTFNNKEEVLNRLLDSLNNQTMKKSDFDVLFIDDGSDDFSAYKRLKDKASKHSNYYVYRIAPSGWSSRPRNTGIDLANSKYIFFSDDDDTIFPQALEKMYNFAEKNNLDVVNPKVIRTKGWSWGWDRFKENRIDAQLDGVTSMGPMTVPKLYKKDFLVKNNLYFTEGEKVWWEDVIFSSLVYSKNPKIGILADYPVYHWREQNVSAGFGRNLEHRWKQLNYLGEFFNKNLVDDDKNTLLAHWYKSRVLNPIRKNFHSKKPNVQKLQFENAKKWKKLYVDNRVIDKLDTKHKILDQILELNDSSLAVTYSEMKSGITARSYIKNISFDQEKIVFTTEALLTYNEEDNVNIKGKPTKAKIDLPKDLKKNLPKELTYYNDIDYEGNMYLPALKGRFSRATWEIKDIENSEFKYNKTLTGYNVKATTTFKMRLQDYFHDEIDCYQPFDIAMRFSYLDFFSQRAIAVNEDFKKTALINGHTFLLYKNKSGLLSIDVNSTVKNFLSAAKLEINKYSIYKNYINIPLKADYCYGDTSVELLGSIFNNTANKFIETKVHLITESGKSYISILNNNSLTGKCTIDIAIGRKSHRLYLDL